MSFLQISKYTKLLSLNVSSTSRVLILDIPPPSNPPGFPHTPTSSNSKFGSQFVSPSFNSTEHSERHLVLNISLHPMSISYMYFLQVTPFQVLLFQFIL